MLIRVAKSAVIALFATHFEYAPTQTVGTIASVHADSVSVAVPRLREKQNG